MIFHRNTLMWSLPWCGIYRGVELTFTWNFLWHWKSRRSRKPRGTEKEKTKVDLDELEELEELYKT